MIEVDPDEYGAVRAEPRQFIVFGDHVVPSVEVVVREADLYVVVEKIRRAAEVAGAHAGGSSPSAASDAT